MKWQLKLTTNQRNRVKWKLKPMTEYAKQSRCCNDARSGWKGCCRYNIPRQMIDTYLEDMVVNYFVYRRKRHSQHKIIFQFIRMSIFIKQTKIYNKVNHKLLCQLIVPWQYASTIIYALDLTTSQVFVASDVNKLGKS